MRVHVLQHADFEGPGAIESWAASRRHTLTSSFSPSEQPPALETVDLLVVLGGPMGANDEDGHPWLRAEKEYLTRAVRGASTGGPRVLAICLGAQLLAAAAGGSVRRNGHPEIGWFRVTLTAAGRASRAVSALPESFVPGHWHGDTFDLPSGIESCAVSQACANQAFECAGGRAVGLQFHLEWTAEDIARLVEHAGGDLAAGGRFVQPLAELSADADRLAESHGLLFALLDRMEAL